MWELQKNSSGVISCYCWDDSSLVKKGHCAAPNERRWWLGGAAQGGCCWWQCYSLIGLGTRDSLHHQQPHPASLGALTPSWPFQAGLPSTVVILETLLRLGTNLLSSGWPCTSSVSCTGSNSELHVPGVSTDQAPQAQGCFWKPYLTYGECPLDLFGQLFFFQFVIRTVL